ncbi:cytochrome c biogenesis CcdA family protein [Halalkalibacterium halodurans]|uniref:cytochrome c biogenesis CcdA family protein n=1 Tax=Halalkalibacterium halodurans TaxID=86665 RepID=UPI0010673EED|nr:cytochrome c biogenesis CcdA family protein [Halalkalibacterium halodurans]MED3648851.1 cytochrome c biogenesis CcdA family protein [Halalkalibacterium halodurans]TES58006.1 cytochrome c biogenesis protein CcdA [Halalkalibacterium halodurans]
MVEVTIWLAFFAGVVSFLSPCVFPLVPVYLAQLTGTQISGNEITADRKLILMRSLGFILGFTSIFIFLGASSTFIGQLFWGNRQLFEQIGGIIITVFGLQMMGVISIRMLLSEKRLQAKPRQSASFANSVLIGFLFATGWTPCIGLVLGAILILAGDANTMWSGMSMLFVYSMGLAIPFFLVALLWSRSLHKVRKLNKWLPTIQKGSGVVMVALGVLLFTGQFSTIAAYLARFNPFGI